MAEPGVLLDIDGTLLDTNWLHTVAWWRAFRSLELTFPMATIHHLIGMGGDKLVPELAGKEVDGAEDAYSREFRKLRSEAVRLPGAQELIRQLDRRGLRVVLASSAQEEDLDHFRSVIDMDDHLAGATSSGDADESKPDQEIFEVAMDRFDLDRARTVVIGDTGWDGDAAAKAELPFVAVQTGGWTVAELQFRGAIAVHDDAADLAREVTRDPSWAVW
jgi:HAD superfamily hydrolase (TIGR01549 family)